MGGRWLKLSASSEACLAVVRSGGLWTAQAVAQAAQMDLQNASARLRGLVSSGRIADVGTVADVEAAGLTLHRGPRGKKDMRTVARVYGPMGARVSVPSTIREPSRAASVAGPCRIGRGFRWAVELM